MVSTRARPLWVVLMAVVGILAAAAGSARGAGPEELLFPSWPDLEIRIAFWIDIYTRYTTRQAVIHDAEYPHVIYGVVELGGIPTGQTEDAPDTDEEIMRLARERVQGILRQARGAPSASAGTLEVPRRVHEAWLSLPEGEPRDGAADRVRVQRGQSDRFRLSLVRSGRYLESLRATARQMGVPEALAELPYVESSFDPLARSHAGAAGLWQLMRGTARPYLRVDGEVDERLDPWISARAAFRILRENHASLDSWPLALTAYNHGLNGMRRARRLHGDDLERIIREYRSRYFGFASKNFYAEFLAARRVARSPERWFGALSREPPLRHETFFVPEFVRVRALADSLAMPVPELQVLNPALDPGVWSGTALVPRGYGLRVPPGGADRLAAGWSRIPATDRFERDVKDVRHRVRRGENLSVIASRYGTSVSRLRSLNGLRNQRYIYPGQVLMVRRSIRWTSVAEREAALRPERHVVRRGETLTGIGIRYGIALRDLIHANGIRDASRILVGQVLLIPRSE
jgi:membrane-bound lytic murein transglycosylase D